MQVSVPLPEQRAKVYPWKMKAGTVRQEVFTRRGGLWLEPVAELPGELQRLFPLRRLQRGMYASRSAAFQNAVSKTVG